MRIIFKIAKNELRYLFYSPIAWLLLVLFFAQCAYFYFDTVQPLAHTQDIQLANSPYFRDWDSSLTRQIFINGDGIFQQVVNNLYLFIPLLTMSIFSREISGGTDKLLFSTRVTTRQIILGKYLGIILFALLFLLIVLVFIGFGAATINNAEHALLLAGAFSFFLMIGVYCAIGLFMSTLTNYPIISAVGTFSMLFLLQQAGQLWQQYDIIRDLTWFLSLSGRNTSMVLGLISSKDVIYFVLLIFLFLGLSLVRVQTRIKVKAWYLRALQYGGVILITLVIGYISALPALTSYWDVTRDHVRTLHPRTQAVLKELDPHVPLTVTLYCNLFDNPTAVALALPAARNAYLHTLWEPYLRFRPDIRFKYVYYYDYDSTIVGNNVIFELYPGKTIDQIAAIFAQRYGLNLSMFLPAGQIRHLIDLRPEGKTLVMQLDYDGRKEFLRLNSEGWPGEKNVSAALKRLLGTALPAVSFTTGHYERSPFKTGEREFAAAVSFKSSPNSLINTGFDIDTVDLDSQPVREQTRVLVVADPRSAFSPVALNKIERYVEAGGNMLVIGEPGKQPVIDSILSRTGTGLRMLPGILVEPKWWETPDKVFAFLDESTGLRLADEQPLLAIRDVIRYRDTHPELKTFGLDTFGAVMPGVCAIGKTTRSTFTIIPFLHPKLDSGWLKAGGLVTDSAAPVFDPSAGDQHGQFQVGVIAKRKLKGKDQKIMVLGDADFASNLRLGAGTIPAAAYSYLVDNTYPIYTPHRRPTDTLLHFTEPSIAVQRLFLVWIVPFLLFLAGAILLIRRKRQ